MNYTFKILFVLFLFPIFLNQNYRKPETRNPKLETRNPKLETRN
jgi:hypothetical protein